MRWPLGSLIRLGYDSAMEAARLIKSKNLHSSSRLWFNDQQLRKDVGEKHAKFRSYAVRTQ